MVNIRGNQALNGSIQRDDLDVSTPGQAVVRKILAGTGVSLTQTGPDTGTGDVTVAAFTNATSLFPGNYYSLALTAGGTSTLSQTANSLRAYPWFFPAGATLNEQRCEVTTLLAASRIRFGIYANMPPGNFYPGALLANSDAEHTGDTAGVKTQAANVVIPSAGWYWLVSNANAAIAIRVHAVSNVSPAIGANPAMGTSPSYTGYSVASAYGALPANFPAGPTKIITAPPVSLWRAA